MVLQGFIEKVSERFGKLKLVLPILSGLFLGVGFLFPEVRFLSWLALLPLLFFFDCSGSVKEFFWGGFLAGFIFFGQVFIWYFNALPLDWFGINNRLVEFYLVFFIWLVAVSFSALFLGLFGLVYRRFPKNNRLVLLSIPSLWIIFEYLRAWGLTFLFWGDNSSLGPYWTFGHLGYLLSASPVLGELAGFGGVYLLSFLIVLVNTAFYTFLKKGTVGKRTVIFLFLIALCFFVSGYFPFTAEVKNEGQFMEVAVLNTQFATRQGLEEKFRVQQELLEEIAGFSQKPQFIVLPEGSQFLVYSPQRAEQLLATLFPSEKILLVDVSKYDSADGSKNRITFFDTEKGVVDYQDKIFLMPFGEYQPYVIKWPAGIIARDWLDKVNHSRSFAGGNNISTVDFSGIKIGGLFCGDIISPDLYRKLSRESQIILNVGNHSSFQNSYFLTNQIQSVSRVRAAENNRYLVRAANGDFSYIIDNRGGLVGETETKRNTVLFGDVTPLLKRSFYNKYGDWLLLAALAVLLLTITPKRGIIGKS